MVSLMSDSLKLSWVQSCPSWGTCQIWPPETPEFHVYFNIQFLHLLNKFVFVLPFAYCTVLAGEYKKLRITIVVKWRTLLICFLSVLMYADNRIHVQVKHGENYRTVTWHGTRKWNEPVPQSQLLYSYWCRYRASESGIFYLLILVF